MSFARWNSYESCVFEQTKLGHSRSDAEAICDDVQKRLDAGTLYKSGTLEIVKSGRDIITYGPATWELIDPEFDYVTTEAQTNFLTKLFTKAAYRTVMDEHQSFQAGTPLLKYVTRDGRKYLSHVHEKGMMLVTKARPDDGLEQTRELRKKLLSGYYHSYSIRGKSIRNEERIIKGQRIIFHYDIDPAEISYCRTGVNPKAAFRVIQKSYLGDDSWKDPLKWYVRQLIAKNGGGSHLAKPQHHPSPELRDSTPVLSPEAQRTFDDLWGDIVRGRNELRKRQKPLTEAEARKRLKELWKRQGEDLEKLKAKHDPYRRYEPKTETE